MIKSQIEKKFISTSQATKDQEKTINEIAGLYWISLKQMVYQSSGRKTILN